MNLISAIVDPKDSNLSSPIVSNIHLLEKFQFLKQLDEKRNKQNVKKKEKAFKTSKQTFNNLNFDKLSSKGLKWDQVDSVINKLYSRQNNQEDIDDEDQEIVDPVQYDINNDDHEDNIIMDLPPEKIDLNKKKFVKKNNQEQEQVEEERRSDSNENADVDRMNNIENLQSVVDEEEIHSITELDKKHSSAIENSDNFDLNKKVDKEHTNDIENLDDVDKEETSDLNKKKDEEHINDDVENLDNINDKEEIDSNNEENKENSNDINLEKKKETVALSPPSSDTFENIEIDETLLQMSPESENEVIDFLHERDISEHLQKLSSIFPLLDFSDPSTTKFNLDAASYKKGHVIFYHKHAVCITKMYHQSFIICFQDEDIMMFYEKVKQSFDDTKILGKTETKLSFLSKPQIFKFLTQNNNTLFTSTLKSLELKFTSFTENVNNNHKNEPSKPTKLKKEVYSMYNFYDSTFAFIESRKEFVDFFNSLELMKKPTF